MSTPIYLLVIYLVAGSPTPIITTTATPDMQTCKALGERVKDMKVYDVVEKRNVFISGTFQCIDPTAVATISRPAQQDMQQPPR